MVCFTRRGKEVFRVLEGFAVCWEFVLTKCCWLGSAGLCLVWAPPRGWGIGESEGWVCVGLIWMWSSQERVKAPQKLHLGVVCCWDTRGGQGAQLGVWICSGIDALLSHPASPQPEHREPGTGGVGRDQPLRGGSLGTFCDLL